LSRANSSPTNLTWAELRSKPVLRGKPWHSPLNVRVNKKKKKKTKKKKKKKKGAVSVTFKRGRVKALLEDSKHGLDRSSGRNGMISEIR